MLTKGEAANNYNGIMQILTENNYYFRTTEGETLTKGEFDYQTLINKLSSIEYLDCNDCDSYSKYFINPAMRMLILVSVDRSDDGRSFEFRKLPFEVLEIIYDQLRQSVMHGYRLALDDVRKNISNLFKEDRSIADII